MKQIILETIFKHMKDKVIGSSPHEFMTEKFCLINLIAFYDEMNSLVNER